MAIPIYERQGTVRALPGAAAHYAGDGGQTALRERRYSGNMKFEAGQILAFRDKEAGATMAGAMERIAASYDDDAVVAAEKERLYQALELKVRGLGPEAVREVEDKIGASHIVGMIREDSFVGQSGNLHDKSASSFRRASVEPAVDRSSDIRRSSFFLLLCSV